MCCKHSWQLYDASLFLREEIGICAILLQARGGTNNGSRKISGLSGMPSSYAGSHSSCTANRPGPTSPSASSLVATTRNSLSDGLGTSPNPVKKISFTGESVTGVLTTDACPSHQTTGSILRKSHHTASSLSKTLVEDDVRMSLKWKLTDGSATLECMRAPDLGPSSKKRPRKTPFCM